MEEQHRLSRTMRSFLWLAVLSLAAVGMGCGSGKGGAKVSGTVKYKGKPLPSGTVTFFDAKKEIVGSSAIKDGSYAVEGVPPGKMMVSVTTPPAVKVDPRHPPPKDMPGEPPLPVMPIPAQYGNPEQSGLTYDVKAGNQDFPIELR
jgi:hypothetical protein